MLTQSIHKLQQTPDPQAHGPDWRRYLDTLVQHRWLVAGVTAAAIAASLIWSLLASSAYESNLLLKVRQTEGRPRSGPDVLAVSESKAQAVGEIEMLRSRAVLGPVVEQQGLAVVAEPRFVPLVGRVISKYNSSDSTPLRGYVWGSEAIRVGRMSVPEELEGKLFVLTLLEGGRFRLEQKDTGIREEGQPGVPLKIATAAGEVELAIDSIKGRAGAEFTLRRLASVVAIEGLEKRLAISEKGRESGVISVVLRGPEPRKTAQTLNAIGQQYVRENSRQLAEEAEQSLAFLNRQLPDFKRGLERSEARYSEMRSRRGSVDLSEDAKSVLQQSVIAQTRLAELRQKKEELLTRFTESHPSVEAISRQIAEATQTQAAVNARIKSLPSVEQDVVGATRDMKANNDVYTAMLGLSRELALRELSKIGNVKLVDQAAVAKNPVSPRPALLAALAAVAGMVLGLAAAFLRKTLSGEADDPERIEHQFGVPVYATVLHSEEQKKLFAQMHGNNGKLSILAQEGATDGVVDSLRAFRSTFQFTMRNAKNNVVVVTGPTAGVGKSFVAANFAAVLASSGKRVVLVDADMRMGYLNRYFGKPQEPGLAELLAGRTLPDRVLHRNLVENVDFLACGHPPARPAELLEHANLSRLLGHLSELYDFVLVDTPPVLMFTDALSVAAHAGRIFNVVRAGQTSIGEVEYSLKALAKAGHPVSGLIFNDMKHRGLSYRYGSQYGPYSVALQPESKMAGAA
jgi:tyrosine-protein kinase Etk/Wzc